MKGTALTRAACFTSSSVPWATSTTMPSRLHSRITSAPSGLSPPHLAVLGLLVAELARHVVHDLELADAPAIHLPDPLEPAVHEVAALDGADERGPPRRLRGLEIGRGQHPHHAVRAPRRESMKARRCRVNW